MLYRFLVLSTVLHAVLIWPLAAATIPSPPRQTPGGVAAPRTSEIRVQLSPYTPATLEPSGTSPCGHRYFGMGLTTAWATHVVLAVPRRSPAAAAGVQSGDRLLDNFERVAEGEAVNLTLQRGARVLHVKVRRGWICDQG